MRSLTQKGAGEFTFDIMFDIMQQIRVPEDGPGETASQSAAPSQQETAAFWKHQYNEQTTKNSRICGQKLI